MQEMAPAKRHTLAAALIKQQSSRALDDLAEIFIKRMMRSLFGERFVDEAS
jgi:hypothetical protein